jgi:hypothetical protein
MLFKKLMSEYAYRLFLGLLFIKVPFLAAPWLRPFVTFFADRYLMPVFAIMGTYIDFRIIDYQAALADAEYKEIVLEIKKIDDEQRAIEDYDPKEIQAIRDRFHSKLKNLIRQPSSYT